MAGEGTFAGEALEAFAFAPQRALGAAAAFGVAGRLEVVDRDSVLLGVAAAELGSAAPDSS